MATGEPAFTHTIVFGCAAATARTIASCSPGRWRSGRSWPSQSRVGPVPTTTIATSAAAAVATASSSAVVEISGTAPSSKPLTPKWRGQENSTTSS